MLIPNLYTAQKTLIYNIKFDCFSTSKLELVVGFIWAYIWGEGGGGYNESPSRIKLKGLGTMYKGKKLGKQKDFFCLTFYTVLKNKW